MTGPSEFVIAVSVTDVREHGPTAAIVLQQLRWYGHLKESKDGWVRRSLAEWETITGLTSQIVHRTLHKLRDAGVIEMVGAGNAPKSWRIVPEQIAVSQSDAGVSSRNRDAGSRIGNTGIAVSQSGPLLQSVEEVEDPTAQARRVLDAAWSVRKAEGRTPTNFHAALNTTKALLKAGRPEADVIRGLTEAPTLSIPAVEIAIERGRARPRRGPTIADEVDRFTKMAEGMGQ